MPITTELLGKLGGTPETRTVEISGNVDVSIPAGWKKAVGVLTGDVQDSSPRILGTRYSFAGVTNRVSIGAVLNAGETAETENAYGTITWYRLE